MIHTDLMQQREQRCKKLPSSTLGHQAPLTPPLLPLYSQKIHCQGETRLTKWQPWAFWPLRNALILPQCLVVPSGLHCQRAETPGGVTAGGPSLPVNSGRCVHPEARGHSGALWGWLMDLRSDLSSAESETQLPQVPPIHGPRSPRCQE